MNCIQQATTVQQVVTVEKADYLPSRDQITDMCLLIQAGWSIEERSRRWHQQLSDERLLKYAKPFGENDRVTLINKGREAIQQAE